MGITEAEPRNEAIQQSALTVLAMHISPQPTDRFDAVMVGSGISGGWAAKELTKKGLRV